MFLAVGAAVLLAPAARAAEESGDVLAVNARAVLRQRCAACHDGEKARAGLRVLNSASLTRKDHQLVTPGRPEESELLQLVECGTMPPGTRPKVPQPEREVLREWIRSGAPDFPAPYTETYALATILLDVRAARKAGGADRDLADERYVALNHLRADEKTAAALPLFRAALTKALNQLSTGPKLVTLTPVDPDETIFRVRLSDLGWDARPFTRKDVSLYDLLLLDYPLASAPPRAPAERTDRQTLGQLVTEEYLATVRPLRPVPYIRGDWLAGVATQAPLYEDMLRLPPTLGGLERRVGAGADAARAGLTESNVLNCDRIVERRPAGKASLWRTYDLAGKTGLPALVADAKTTQGGGEAIFRLPNGLPGYFVADARGMRQEEIPEAHLKVPLNKEGVRNGLSCMVCHAEGLKAVRDEVRPRGNPELKGLEELYPEAAQFAALLDADRKAFVEGLEAVRKGSPEPEPLGPALSRFKEAMTHREHDSTVLVNLEEGRRQRAPWDTRLVFAGGPEAMARLDREGAPPALVPPVDAHGVKQVVGKSATDKVKVTAVKVSKDKDEPTEEFRPGDVGALVVENTGEVDLYFELVLTTASGRIEVLAPAEEDKGKLGVLKPGERYRWPTNEKGKGIALTAAAEGEWTKQRCTVYAAAEPFPPGAVLRMSDQLPPGEYVADRFVHTFYEIKDGRLHTLFDPAKMVKKSAEFEIKAK
jgi:serine/threonine-protein kinase